MSDLFPTLGRWFAEAFPSLARALRAVGRGLKKLGRLVLYLLVLLLIVHIPATIITGLMVRKEISRIRDAGEALTTRELAPTVPAGERNAADVYQKAFDALRLSTDENEKLFTPGTDHDEAWMAVANQAVAANTEYFALLDEASQIPACAFPVDWDAGFEMTFPHFAGMREAARMLALRAEVLAAAGDSDAAIASCGAAFRVAEHAKLDPILIGQLVAYAIQDITASGLETILANEEPSPEAARRLFDQLATIEQEQPFKRSMEGERTFGLFALDFVRRAPVREVAGLLSGGMPDEAATPWQVVAALLYRTAGRPLFNLDELAFLHTWDASRTTRLLCSPGRGRRRPPAKPPRRSSSFRSTAPSSRRWAFRCSPGLSGSAR